MKKLYTFLFSGLLGLILTTIPANAQQLPNAGFEDWSAEQYDGKIQPASWNASNVTQVGMKFNFAHREAGHSGSWCMMVQNQSVGAAGITESAPGHFSLGQPWAYLPSITQLNQATAGTYGGINFTYRPDSMEVWIRRTGNDWTHEDFYLLFYAWKGTAKGTSYKGKNGSCTSVSYTNEESDIRQALDGNECTTTQFATQICEGMWRERAEYQDWTKITVPIYYLNNDVPEMCNVIFSASNYPNFRANSGLYVGNSLYVDDVRLIYSSKIQHLYIGNKEWKGFDPNSTEIQQYSVGNNATSIPDIYAIRGEGSLTNARGNTAPFPGRRLADSEISITNGTIDGEPTVITVTAADGSSTSTYRIQFISEPSHNAYLADIKVNGNSLAGFKSVVPSYNVSLPYGTNQAPVVEAVKAEDAQTVTITQATSPAGTATINVKAADNRTTATYTLNFSVAALSDNTLQGIKVNGEPIPSFQPLQTIYKVELPLGTTTMPTIEAISAYPAGEQTIEYTAPAQIDGGQYQIAVSTPGNTTPKVYKLNFKITASTNCKLQNLTCGDYIQDFDPNTTTYYVNLPIGTTSLPTITYVAGDGYQTISKDESGVNGTDGTVRIIVTAANGDQTIYKIVFTTERSSINTLQNIFIGGVELEGFAPERLNYEVVLPIGTTELPAITWTQGDEYQNVSLRTNGVNGTARIIVTAGDGSSKLYQINFSVLKANNANLQMIYLDGTPLEGFAPNILEYTINLPESATVAPVITVTAGDEWQSISTRSTISGVTGDYKITVRPQEGAAQTYTLHFTQTLSANTNLAMIYLDGTALEGFAADITEYSITLPMGVSQVPNVSFDKAEASQTVLPLIDHTTVKLRVTALSGDSKVYTIQFTFQKSENALLQMIYIDGQPLADFNPNVLTGYEVVLNGNSSPIITVDKEMGQQVTIMAPQGAGEAQIIVQPETGTSNTYRILFTHATDANLLLADILIDGVSLNGFAPETEAYTVNYIQHIPTISFTKRNDSQEVTVLQDGDDVRLLVTYQGRTFTYTIHFTQEYSADCNLQSILVDGVQLAGFNTNVTNYSIDLAAGAAQPAVTYVLNNDRQSAVIGHTAANTVSITVTAEDGTTQKTYTVAFNQAKYNDATLLDLQLDGATVAGFAPTTYNYTINIENGADLPALSYTARTGCHTISANTGRLEQKVWVIAESGAKAEYTITYHEQQSNNALLSDIKLNGTSLEGFASNTYSYTYVLPRLTNTVPTVQPIAANAGQTITVYFSRPDGTTKIHVLAADGVTEANYTIAFPVEKSSNTTLDAVEFDGIDFTFNANTRDYTLTYDGNAVPQLYYEKHEAEQRVEIELRGLGQTTTLRVIAENGTTEEYHFDIQRVESSAPNRLKTIAVNGQTLTLTEGVFDYTCPLPYGTKAMSVTYEKNYDAQAVVMQPGGVYHPTILTVHANRAGEADVVYTLTPAVDTNYPARLTSISVNGTALAEFDPDRTSYIISVSGTETPQITYSRVDGVMYLPVAMTSKTWKLRAIAGEYEREYTLYFYYQDFVIPNGEFTEWTTATYNSAAKPVGWQVIADYVDKYRAGLGTYTFGKEIEQNGTDVVYLHSLTGGSGISATGGMIPGMMTLGTMNPNIASAGSSTFDVGGSIVFKNTPDELHARYYQSLYSKNTSHNRIIYQLNGNKVIFEDTQVDNDFKEVSINLAAANTNVTEPTTMNIIVNSFFQENATNLNDGSEAKMYLDWLRFYYNSRLTTIQVNGEAAEREGNHFTFTLADAEQTGIPSLTFIGEVSDQAQDVVWSAEVNGVRNATIRNYAEDGTYTDYTLQVVRPLSTIASPASIVLNNGATELNTAQTEHHISLPFGYKGLPSLTVEPQTSLQTITVTENAMQYVITVTAENGTATTYTIDFEVEASNSTDLALLTADGVSFDKDIRDYTLNSTTLPDFTFLRESDGQTALLSFTDKEHAVISVTAENGTTGTYTFTLVPPTITTSALLTTIELDGFDIKGYNKNTFEYTHDAPELTSFEREYETDSVIQTITPTHISWRVIGSVENTYTVTYPTDPSTECGLGNILLNGATYEDFDKDLHNYELHTDEYIDIQLVRGNENQALTLSYTAPALTITPKAEDGTICEAYSISILEDLSNNAYLNAILIDGVPLQDFTKEQLNYTYTIPCANPKIEQPSMPSISYQLGQESQSVVVETAGLGGTTYITVTSEDGSAVHQYEITVQAEPSHNAQLNNIVVNNEPVSHFEPNRHWYSAQVNAETVEITYSTLDRYQTITQSVTADGVHTIHVIAEDGVTEETYYVELWEKALSNNAFLADIRLNEQTFNEYDARAANFQPKQLRYTLNLPTGETTLPDIYVALGENGQTWTLLQGADVDTIRVTAPDGFTTNDYILNFMRVKSSNTQLMMIYWDGKQVNDFQPEVYTYSIDLPIGETTLPRLDVLTQESVQSYNITWVGNTAMIVVTAENGDKATYELHFNLTQSDVCHLLMIYADEVPLADFESNKYNYYYLLDLGIRDIPSIAYDEADQWQTITVDTITTTNTTTYQIRVVAGSGLSRTYSVAFELQQSNINTLEMILLNGHDLEGFNADQLDYTITLPYGTTELPEVDYISGDNYQTVTITMGELNGATRIVVVAENGNSRTYNLTFLVEKSHNADLNMIAVAGTNIANFDGEIYNYNLSLPYGSDQLPIITFEKGEEGQNVHLQTTDTWQITITVTAADGVTQSTYTLNFTILRSDYALLDAILLDGKRLATFEPNITEYNITLPHGTTELPEVTYTLGNEQQTVNLQTDGLKVTVEVIAGDGEEMTEYILHFEIEKSSINTLDDLQVRGETLIDFAPDIQEYEITYPAGSTEDDFFTAEDITFTLTDEAATVDILSSEDGTFTILVTAEDGTTNAYVLRQTILLESMNLLKDLQVNGVRLQGFDPNVFEYEYLLYEGGIIPTISATAESELATVDITYGQANELSYIYCTAEDGSESIYTILFSIADINTAAPATEKDVCVKQIPGTHQFFAATSRQNVQFALYDLYGHCYVMENMPLCDPNTVTLVKDSRNDMAFFNINLPYNLTTTQPNVNPMLTDNAVSATLDNGIVFELPTTGSAYFYVFFQGNQKLSSGKLMLAR